MILMRRTIIKAYKLVEVEDTFDSLTDEFLEDVKVDLARSVLYKASELREEDVIVEVVFDGEVYDE